MVSVYGEPILQDDASQLNGGIEDDKTWQNYWRQLIVYPTKAFDVPNKSTGKRFISNVAGILRDIKSRKCNSEKLIVYIIVTLQRERGVTSAGDINKRIANRMKAWSEGKYEMLVQDTLATNEALLSTRR